MNSDDDLIRCFRVAAVGFMIIILIMIVLKVLDGDNHRLGVILLSTEEMTNEN